MPIIHRYLRLIAVFTSASVLLGGCSSSPNGPSGMHNTSWYMKHTAARDKENAWCDNHHAVAADISGACANAHMAEMEYRNPILGEWYKIDTVSGGILKTNKDSSTITISPHSIVYGQNAVIVHNYVITKHKRALEVVAVLDPGYMIQRITFLMSRPKNKALPYTHILGMCGTNPMIPTACSTVYVRE